MFLNMNRVFSCLAKSTISTLLNFNGPKEHIIPVKFSKIDNLNIHIYWDNSCRDLSNEEVYGLFERFHATILERLPFLNRRLRDNIIENCSRKTFQTSRGLYYKLYSFLEYFLFNFKDDFIVECIYLSARQIA